MPRPEPAPSAASPSIVSDAVATPALAELRHLIRARHRGNADRGDLLYRAYVTVLAGLFGFYLALGAIDDAPIGPDQIGWFERHGAAWVGLAAAFAVGAGLRSGVAGGPLALDPAELHYVVMAPIDRRVALRDNVRRLLVTASGIGALAGLVAGELAQRRLPGSTLAWLGSGLLLGATLTVGAAGVALTAASLPVLRRRPWISPAISVALVLWSIVDIVEHWSSAPTTAVGRIALWPLDFAWWAFVAPVTVVVLVVVGSRGVGRLSIERAQRRAHLIRQVRFALAQQDIRSLILLRRQLGFERPRARPLVRVAPGRTAEANPVVYRDLCSFLRWPVQRMIRVGALAVAAGLALGATWRGTTAMALAYAPLSYLASLEVVEPFNQELDHQTILDGVPVPVGRVLVFHLMMSTGAMTLWMGATAAVGAAVARSADLLAVLAVAALPSAAAAVGGGAISTKRVAVGESALFMPDEVAGPAALFRLVWPVALAGLGALPVIVAHHGVRGGDTPLASAAPVVVAVAMAGVAMLAWIRFRDELTTSMATATAEAGRQKTR